MRKLLQFSGRISSILEFLIAFFFSLIFALVVLLVVLRYAFNTSIIGANEVITILFVYTTSIGSALAVKKRGHIAIPVMVDLLPPKARRCIDLVGLSLILLINAVMLFYSLSWIKTTGNFLMPATGLPRMTAQLCIPLGCGLSVLYCLTLIANSFAQTPSQEDSHASLEKPE
ncbi:MAG TPA: TRAP transporter small permease [Verrucomicrobiales bacterium]|nr:TRAP transporter small permease [Verrucomicrobiales bacterium]HIL71874.1 TRAP transporter small permease [Verrucomicrobiota bacterium]